MDTDKDVLVAGSRIIKKFHRRGLRGVERRTVNFRQARGIHSFLLPNLFTTGNMFFGFMSIIKSIHGEYTWAAYAIVAAAIFDLFDGRVARLTNSTSHFGAEYDSLSDLVSFGMAPGILMYLWALNPFGRLGWLVSFIFVACGALRLARFNVQLHTVQRKDFQGLPIPMAAGIVASAVLAFQDLGLEAYRSWSLLTMTALLSGVMVSTFRYRSFKDIDFRGRVPFRYLVIIPLLVVIVASRPEVMLFVLFLTYAVLGAVFGILRLGQEAKPSFVYINKLPLDEDEEEGE